LRAGAGIQRWGTLLQASFAKRQKSVIALHLVKEPAGEKKYQKDFFISGRRWPDPVGRNSAGVTLWAPVRARGAPGLDIGSCQMSSSWHFLALAVIIKRRGLSDVQPRIGP